MAKEVILIQNSYCRHVMHDLATWLYFSLSLFDCMFTRRAHRDTGASLLDHAAYLGEAEVRVQNSSSPASIRTVQQQQLFS